LSTLIKAIGGIAPERRIARFAPRPFRELFSARQPNVVGAPVLLWPDTFNNYFHPETAMAAVEVLEHAGYRVKIPQARLCCGRPLYDFGMLEQAKRELRKTLDVLRPQIDAGVPVIGLEPACVAVFRDKMINLFPNDETASKLARQTFMLSEFLVKHANYAPARLAGSALVHGHCHQKAVLGMGDEIKLLAKLGLDFDVLDSGCCGMAGSFGFDKHKYSVSVDIGELVLLPEVRAARPDTLVITNGYSCREQIEQCAGRKALHLAEVIQMAIHRHKSSHPRLHHAERAAEPVEVS
jgi:Fe-S oxidoreductase